MVTDLDGTVVRPDFSISAATLEALDLVQSAGIAFVIATARTPQGLEHFQSLAQRTAMAVCCSGAIGWSSQEQRRTWMDEMAPAEIRHVVEVAVDAGAGVASFDGALVADDRGVLPPQPHAATWANTPGRGECRARSDTLLHHGGAASRQRSRSHRLPRRVGSRLSRAEPRRALDGSRHHGARRRQGDGDGTRAAALGIEPAAAISFGDMPNDLAMFRVTGRCYSVGSADAAVMKAATEVLPSVEDDGFAHKIAELAAGGLGH